MMPLREILRIRCSRTYHKSAWTTTFNVRSRTTSLSRRNGCPEQCFLEDRSRLNGGHIFESEGDMSFDATVASRMKMALRETTSMITVTAVLGERD